MMNFLSLWVEKYRPKTLKDMLLTKDVREFVESIEKSENKVIPHLLFHGPAGGGKCLDGDEELEVYITDDFYKKMQNLKLI